MSFDSEAYFSERINEVGLQACLHQMQGFGWRTMSSFAFASAYLPGSQDDTAFKREVIERLTGDPESAHGPQLRRVFFEAYTMAAADVRRRVERRDEDTPRALPQVEREARRAALDARLTGLDLRGALDPANQIVDAAPQMYEDNIPKHFAEGNRTLGREGHQTVHAKFAGYRPGTGEESDSRCPAEDRVVPDAVPSTACAWFRDGQDHLIPLADEARESPYVRAPEAASGRELQQGLDAPGPEGGRGVLEASRRAMQGGNTTNANWGSPGRRSHRRDPGGPVLLADPDRAAEVLGQSAIRRTEKVRWTSDAEHSPRPEVAAEGQGWHSNVLRLQPWSVHCSSSRRDVPERQTRMHGAEAG